MDLADVLKKINYFAKSSIPVDVEGLAMALGLYVEKQDNLGNISGIIKRRNDKYIIVVNNEHPEVRQRFTISHEIGHFFYHRNKIGDGIVDDALYRHSDCKGIINNNVNLEDEKQANNFAANLLMPTSAITKLIAENNNKIDSSYLADKLKVSTEAINIRLAGLGKQLMISSKDLKKS